MDRSQIPLKRLALAVLVSAVFGAFARGSIPPPFKFHMKKAPRHLDPTLMTLGESTYLFSQLYRGLLRFDGQNKLVFDQAKTCRFKIAGELICELRKEAFWTDGQRVTAGDFVRGFQRLVDPQSQCPVVHLLFSIKNAKAIYQGKAKMETLGVKALSDDKLQISLEENDAEFLEKLSSPYLVPYRPKAAGGDFTSLPTNGPYKIKSWIQNKKIELEPFEKYFGAANNRPPVEIIFAEEDNAGLTLYEKGVINFLWRLPTTNIPEFRNRKDFFQVPVARFDYVGFNMRPGGPFEKKEVRQAFAQALNFEDFKRIFFALGAPGCPGLGEPFLNPEGHCVAYDSKPKKLNLPLIKFMFSQLGGDDIRRQAEWFQEEWKKNLGVTLELRGMEHKQYMVQLAEKPPDAFRIGIALNRPSCSAGLEKFQTGQKENYTGFSNSRFDHLAEAFLHKKMSQSEREGICGVASDLLFKEEFVGIPLGRIHFSMLVKPEYKGWTINELNQLDLSQLTYSP